MKYPKTTAAVLIIAASHTLFAQNADSNESASVATPPVEVAAAESDSAQGAPADDRSYVADFLDKNAELYWVDSANNRETHVKFKSSNSSQYVLMDVSGGAEITVPKDSKNFKFVLKGGDNFNRARTAYGRENWDEAITYLRPMVYPIVGLASLPKENFNGHSYIEMFMSALDSANRDKELLAFIDALPLSDCPVSLISSACEAASNLCRKGLGSEVMPIVNRYRFTSENMNAVPDVLALLAELRKAGKYKECLVVYTKLANMDGNPFKMQSTLLMVYCDLVLGNRMSAEVSLSDINIPREDENFSLQQMVKGMFKSSAEKPDFSAALDLFAEGIVYGSLSSPWMPELMFDAGCAYKKLKQNVAANEIFAQISALWPDDSFSAKAKKEIVKIEKKSEAKKSDSDEE